MLPTCIKDLIEVYVEEMNRFTDLPSSENVLKLVQKSDMFILDTIEKVSRTLAAHLHRDYYCLKLGAWAQYYFVLSPDQKVKLARRLVLAMERHSATSRMLWLFLGQGLHKEPDYAIMFEKSLLVLTFTRVLNVNYSQEYLRI